ncbi:MAG: amylo-alpha-1,6-glucosidase [Salinivirgaceae bacterium]
MKIKNSSGLSIEFLENGTIKHIEVDPIRISLKSATPFSKPGTNLFIRKRSNYIDYKELLGPESNSVFQIKDNTFISKGNWDGLDYTCILQLSPKSLSWQWSIDIMNSSAHNIELDLIYLQDVGLKPITNGLTNEYYVSQYLERLVAEDQNFGSVIYCRQNMKESVGNSWLMLACKNRAIAGSTDGMQFYGKTYRETGIPEGLLSDTLGGNYAGESSIVALQEKPFTLSAGAKHTTVFAATYLPNHPKASSVDDLKQLLNLFHEFGNEVLHPEFDKPVTTTQNIFNIAPFLPVDDLNNQELNEFFGKERRHIEMENGELLSFFCERNNHVVLRSKEVMADRPHGHIMQAQAGFAPNEDIVSTTSFAFGVFNSHISQGNTNFNVLLSVCTSQFNLSTESGQRIFIEIDGKPFLLGVPSAFEMGLNHCRWIYKLGNYCFQVRTWTSKSAPVVHLDFKVLSGKKVKLIITHHFDGLNNWHISKSEVSHESIATPKVGSMIHDKFPKAQFRFLVNSSHINYSTHSNEMPYFGNSSVNDSSLFTIKVEETTAFCLSIIGEVNTKINSPKIENIDQNWISETQTALSNWQNLSLNLSLKSASKDVAAIQEILPWYGMNALTHYLTPYGLEQFSGAAWGTRDVSQGPIDLLLTMEKYKEAKQILCTIFSNQNPDGGWPQWWMFDSYSNIRAHDSHGDVFYWVMISLSDYIKVTGDILILDETLPFYHETGNKNIEVKPISEHIDRLIQMIVGSFIPGTSLVPFGGGDWNDSLQPVNKELAERMISSWTVEMNYQAFRQYSKVFEKTDAAKANEMNEICEKIKSDFNKYLVKDGIVAGYGLVEADKSISVLLHPSDTKTGIQYSILPMNRGIISEIFTPEQAQFHQGIINNHLKGPDGARLMDRPLKYNGGIQTIFQRAESSTFFGREIGLMYVHEHIRYAESQARLGNADSFIEALRQAIPVGYNDIVPCGDIRQANCYYSSSDVTFKSRYEADERCDEIKTGNIMLKGGWRVYSSGPGIYVSMIVTRLLGIRIEFENVIFDPVIPKSMDGLTASIDFMGHSLTLKYKINEDSFSPKAIFANGNAITFHNQENKYRKGGAIIPINQFLSLLNKQNNAIELQL